MQNQNSGASKSWARRPRPAASSPYLKDGAVPKSWVNGGGTAKCAPMPMFKGMPPLLPMPKMPPIIGKMPPMFPMLTPAMYQQMLKKAADHEGFFKKCSQAFAKLPPAHPPGFNPLYKWMPMETPNLFIPPPFIPMPKTGVPPINNATNTKVGVNTSQNVAANHDDYEKAERMSAISDEDEEATDTTEEAIILNKLKKQFKSLAGLGEDDDDDDSDNDRNANVKVGDDDLGVALANAFIPKPPLRYGRGLTLHKVKMFSSLGLKAYAKKMGLDRASLAGFETGPIGNGKLVLLLDLDNTLLHAASQTRLNMLDIVPGHFLDSMQDPELYKFTLANYQGAVYYMKLRPGIREFLQVLSLYYEMSIYTNATREYADAVISILDPDRSLFMDRIVARHAVGEREVLKNATRLYPNLNRRFIVCFDDRKDVWADVPHRQVVRAEHYDFFDSHLQELTAKYSREGGIDAQDPSPNFNFTLPMDCDEHLYHMTRVFLELHRRFFNQPFTANVGDILEEMQLDVLKGSGIFLTGYRKLSKPQEGVLQADCEARQVEIAQELGATVVTKLTDPKLTHLVAGKDNTNNVVKSKAISNEKLSRVHTLWLYACRATWQNVNVEPFDLFELAKAYNNEPPMQPCKDHWRLAKAHELSHADGEVSNSSASCNVKVVPESELPIRIFMGTGPYSHGTMLISPLEKIQIRWDPAKTTLLQNMSNDSGIYTAPTSADTKSLPQGFLDEANEYTPYTNSINPNLY